MSQTEGIVVAIDGPAGAGKSTVARAVADQTGLMLVDTGAIYRAVALRSLEAEIDELDEEKLAAEARALDIRFAMVDGENRVFFGERDVSEDIRRPEISMRASTVSKHPPVRDALMDLQRSLGRAGGGSVLEGRDIGTVVFPDAQVKVFLTATPEERARRRTDELTSRGTPQVFDEVLAEIVARDKQDSERPVAPLKAADDAVVLDSTKLSTAEVIAQIVRLVDAARGGS